MSLPLASADGLTVFGISSIGAQGHTARGHVGNGSPAANIEHAVRYGGSTWQRRVSMVDDRLETVGGAEAAVLTHLARMVMLCRSGVRKMMFGRLDHPALPRL
ncbi:hypothetical protein VaNZ11_004236 [Volvox africanus]|uniref:Uncharacterized protein n=1 Tax=Volvox africanus TaxID=51714 RepID=A0ABQ5RX30_9CHLO|nr:hypothetical protein VaNZ11_004236 [Volvox africanus]